MKYSGPHHTHKMASDLTHPLNNKRFGNKGYASLTKHFYDFCVECEAKIWGCLRDFDYDSKLTKTCRPKRGVKP